jgi:ATP-dependent RNA helicase DeaD
LESEPIDGVLVFVKTRSTTEPLAEYLTQAGLSAAALNGDIAQKQRERIVERLRSGAINVIVATDVAARGLDVQRISHVINYDLPYDSESYVHRIGRTGRAGRSGEAILFVHPRERRWLERLEYTTRQTIQPMPLPTNREINKQRVARFHEKITEALGREEIDVFRSVIEQFRRDNDVPDELIAAALAVMAAGDTPMLVNRELHQTSFADKGGKGKNRRDDSKGNRRDEYRGSDGKMATFRVEVGRKHQIQPGNLVGAIANEASVSREAIGKIKIFDTYSTVDLPQDISSDLLAVITKIHVKGRKLDISRSTKSSSVTRVQVKRGKHPFSKTNGNKSSGNKSSGNKSSGNKSQGKSDRKPKSRHKAR